MVFEQPVDSRESFAAGNENGRTNGNDNQFDEFDAVICSRSTQDKRSRKASTVGLNFVISNIILLRYIYIYFFCVHKNHNLLPPHRLKSQSFSTRSARDL